MWWMNEDRELMVNIAREFAEKEVKPFTPEMENSKYPKHLMKRAGELGFYGLTIPEDAGGIGPDWVTWGLVIEEIAKENNTLCMLIMVHASLGMYNLYSTGNPDQLDKWLKPAISGDITLAFNIAESPGAMNWSEHTTRAVLDGDSWIINGGKIFATHAGKADYHIVVCHTSEFDLESLSGASAIMVPANAPGFEVGHIEHKLGWRGSSSGQIYFRNCRVPRENLLGPQDMLMPVLFTTQSGEFLTLSASFLGSAEGVWAKTLKYTKERMQLGKSMYDGNQVISSALAQMWMDIEMYRHSLYSVLEMATRGMDVFQYSAALRVNGSRMFESVASQCVELHGGNGVVLETGVERYLRDAKCCCIGGGANGFCVDFVAKTL